VDQQEGTVEVNRLLVSFIEALDWYAISNALVLLPKRGRGPTPNVDRGR
jgi:hypothetical protein